MTVGFSADVNALTGFVFSRSLLLPFLDQDSIHHPLSFIMKFLFGAILALLPFAIANPVANPAESLPLSPVDDALEKRVGESCTVTGTFGVRA